MYTSIRTYDAKMLFGIYASVYTRQLNNDLYSANWLKTCIQAGLTEYTTFVSSSTVAFSKKGMELVIILRYPFSNNVLCVKPAKFLDLEY